MHGLCVANNENTVSTKWFMSPRKIQMTSIGVSTHEVIGAENEIIGYDVQRNQNKTTYQ